MLRFTPQKKKMIGMKMDQSSLETEVEGKQRHAPHRKASSKKSSVSIGNHKEEVVVTNQPGVRLGSWNVGSFCGRDKKICEEQRNRSVDVCCVQELRWEEGQGARYVGVQGRKYKLWWTGNSTGVGGVGIMVKEEIC